MVLNVNDLEGSVQQNLRLINYMVWYDYHIHTDESLTRFFRVQNDAKSRLDRLVELGILEQSLCNSYIVAQDPLVQAVIEYVNEQDLFMRVICNNALAF